ncbi:MAG: glycosyltransferase, partial [Candidatus Omnitrophota bacterium]
VPENKIMDLGIPFDQKFNQPCDRNKIFQKLKLNPDLPTILIMGGGQGLGPIKTILKSMEKIKKEIQEIVVCGTNKKLHGSLEKKLHKYKKRIALFGFSQNVHELMSISDMIISKPGGVTAAESLSKEIPMIIVNPLPGQEANNTAYLTEKGTAIKVEAAKTINLVIEDLLENPLKLSSFRESILRIRKPNASFDIAKLLIRLANA